jgi:dTDP-4-dehydrorhamnose reductase
VRILLTGKNGQVGWELQRTLATLGAVHAVDVQDVDLCNAGQVRELVRSLKPELIIHPAAYTAVDKAETDEALAMAVNAKAPAILAGEACQIGAPIVSYSTDYVFDGTAKEPYVEDDEPAPLNVYGRSKLAGDQAIAASGASYLIFRTSWVYGARGANFLRTMLRLGAERDQLSIVADQIGAPTTARSLAEATAQVVAILRSRSGDAGLARETAKVSGVYNMTCGGATSWHGFTEAIFELFESMLGRKPALKAIRAADYPTAAVRPVYSLLSTRKLRETFGIEMPDWRRALELVADDMRESHMSTLPGRAAAKS